MSNWFIVTLLVVALLAISRMVSPGKNQSGDKLTAQHQREFTAATLQVATYNVQTGKDKDGNRDITRSAAVVSEADLIGIQEVYAPGWLNRLGIGQPQSEHLAGSQFAWLFAATRYRWFREQRGNVILSRLPAQAWRVSMLPDQSRKSPRNMIVVDLEWHGQDLVFINTHLHTGRGRSEQLQAVLDEFGRHPRAILVGDFNSRADEPLLQTLLNDPSVKDAVAAAGLNDDPDRIDWIFSKGFDVISGRSLPVGVSDHPYYQVELALPPHDTTPPTNR